MLKTRHIISGISETTVILLTLINILNITDES